MTDGPATDLATVLAIPDDTRRLEALLLTAWTRRHAPTQVLRPLAGRAADLADRLFERMGRLTASALVAHASFRDGEYPIAQRLALEVLQEARLDPEGDPQVWDAALARLPKRVCQALSLAASDLARATFRLADYPNAVLHANLELHLHRSLGDAVGAALALHGLGWGYDKVGLFQKALEHHMQALAELEPIAPERTSSPLNGIAATYLHLGHIDKALQHAQRALDVIGTTPGFERERSTALRTIGIVHHRRGEHATAESYFRRSMAVSDDYGASLNLLSLGEMYLDLGRYEEALAHFRTCLEDLGEGGRKRSRWEALLGIGEVHVACHRTVDAVAVLRDALAAARETGSPLGLQRVHHTLSRAYRAMGALDQALEHFESFHRYREQLLREASDVRIQVLSLQFDVEGMRKDREIDRLRNVELARAYRELQGMHLRLAEQAAELERLSHLDGLTGLHNRRSLDLHLDAEVERVRRSGGDLSLLMLDIDNFKEINDRFSHTMGDEVLKRLARVLREYTRTIDVSARFGGEEFVVVLPDTGPTGALQAGENVRAAFEAVNWGSVLPGSAITISVGVATLATEDDAGTLLARADAELYRAKQGGKNRVCIGRYS